MEPEKFRQSYRCQCFQPHNSCNCRQKDVACDTFMENINDVTDAILEVMNVSGVDLPKPEKFKDVIRYYFLHFEEIRHRIDSIPKKHLCKKDLLFDLSSKCCMHRMSAQIACSIIKRVFKAFYYGTDEGGVPNHFLSEKLRHSSECLWFRAAQRSAEVIAQNMGMFFACQKVLESKIKAIFKKLYDRLQERNLPDEECTCVKCLKRIAKESLRTSKVTIHMHDHPNPYCEALSDDPEQDEDPIRIESSDILIHHSDDKVGVNELGNQVKPRCSCPSLGITKKDNEFHAISESISSRDCSQGPFNVQWVEVSKEEFES